MIFFFDRNISVHIARMINAFERDHSVVHQDYDGRFSIDDDDITIIQTLAEDSPPPVWITADIAQRRNSGERAALHASGMTIVFLKAGFHQSTFHEQAVKVLKIWPSLVRETTRCRQPSVFEISTKFRKVDFVCFTSQILTHLRGK